MISAKNTTSKYNGGTYQYQDLDNIISPNNKCFTQRGIEFSHHFIREIKYNQFECKKYVKILGIITEIKKKSKYIEFTIDDSSGAIRAIYWGCRSEFESLKLTNNFYSNFSCFGVLIEARGIIENYNKRVQLKIINLSTVSNDNYESLWWINIYNRKCSEIVNKSRSISRNNEYDSNLMLNKLFDGTSLFDDEESIEENLKLTELNDICICKKVFVPNTNIPISSSKFILISRIVASLLLRSISIKYNESDEIEEDYISFSINKLLTSTNEVLNTLSVVPANYFSCILNHSKEIIVNEYGYKS
ncbi:OB-fold nucleic acid binding domain-containing protein [Cryptosporidium ryanae]|uniref:OB-fold nucleic acid binding domain-containing protein n=1 Tax=Cryptosporidium ryanae TaxID=515981 RepID=UPI00351A342C|nr:OB-fold nucleic acid binding domain-containing protein [Cryptosporidium ryanae]